MKKVLLIIALICWGVVTAQQEPPPLYLEYDNAGNQVLSDLVCVNCPGEESEKHSLDRITYYPNPVAQELNLSWENTDNNRITAVKVYSLNGKLLTSKNNLNPQTQLNLNFSNKAAGIYIIEIESSDGTTKSFKIIKK